ncbi:patatin-like phospholipase family protein [Acinetobacter stercoris]|uniref:NTE family protein RssA n=1 Tax=Acinetobacter stercoris TaxID=2126983 RepID=A0A2U3N093_9GAMM|nr:patatin-like phospholipase family protein [Acinetobacter stercoris]SPL71045.1 NTE family protein RssA [Acinetobacter stercoris]
MQYLKKIALIFTLILAGCQGVPLHSEANLVKPVQEAESHLNQKPFEYIHQQQKRPVVALVLGSGGARGYAHIGVIQVLEEYGIKPDFIVGTSAGSIVGSIYASGKSPEELRQIALDMKVGDVRDIKIGMKGFFDGTKVENYINQQVEQTPLQNLRIPMYVVATELKEGKKVVFNQGNTGQAVRASVSIPSMFIPTTIEGKEYVDGGLVSPVPVDVARDLGADIIIAVDILAQPIYTQTSNIWGLFNQNINIMQNKLASEELKNADIIIQPDLREKAHIFDTKERQETMQAGVDAAMKQVNMIQMVFNEKDPNNRILKNFQVQN